MGAHVSTHGVINANEALESVGSLGNFCPFFFLCVCVFVCMEPADVTPAFF